MYKTCSMWRGMLERLGLALLRRRSEARVLEDLEVLMVLEEEEAVVVVVVVVVAEEAVGMDACLARSWGPGLGSPTLVAPPFSMALCLLSAGGRRASRHLWSRFETCLLWRLLPRPSST